MYFVYKKKPIHFEKETKTFFVFHAGIQIDQHIDASMWVVYIFM